MAHNLTQDSGGYLAAVRETSSSDAHLVKLRQSSAWSNKEFRVTPSAGRWVACMATGIEAHPNTRGGSAVYADTNNLIAAVGTCMDGLTWRSGYHPCVNAFMRGRMKGPYSHRSGVVSSNARSEYVHSAVSYKFNLHRLHFSKMSSFSAFLRVYVPSLLFQSDYSSTGLYYCTLESSALMNDASKLCCLVSASLPTLCKDVAEGRDEWEIFGVANDGNYSQSGFQIIGNHSVCYNPYHGDDCVSMPVWTANQRSASGIPSSEPTMYYHDFSIANATNLDVFVGNPPEVWVTTHFKRRNAFSHETSSLGLYSDSSCCAWFYRADLVLKCSSSTF